MVIENNKNIIRILLLFIGISLLNTAAYGQVEDKEKRKTNMSTTEVADTNRASVSYNKHDSTSFQQDTIQDQHNDISALDIATDRGIFILSSDRMMQMRILGSIRAAFNYSDQDLQNKNTFDPYEIPTNNHTRSPNFYAGLSQTRIGLEVTRRTKKQGDIFVRFEGDFANTVSSFRIRHAYGQFKHLLIGQTWSLFNNVGFQSATVSVNGPAGSIGIRTPQIRYYATIKKITWYVGIEYSTPDLVIPDSVKGAILQVIPDFAGRIRYKSGPFTGHVSAIITTISGRDTSGKISYSFGFGGSIAGRLLIKQKNSIYFSLTTGRGISHFFDALNGKGEDAAYNPANQGITALYSTGGYVSFTRDLPEDLSSSLSFGMIAISNKDYQPANAYSYSYNALLNVFWQPLDGARLGIEYAFGERFDNGGARGRANRVSMLLYYDF
jgi:hypothetical protein